MKRIGIFGGSFDPIHLGHVCLAIEMLEAHKLDSVLFCPANSSPFKSSHAAAPPEHREAMVRLAVKDIPQLECSRIDLERPAPSYTVDTLRELHRRTGNTLSLFLILGEDHADTFFSWHQPEEIIKLSTVIIGKRTIEANNPQQRPDYQNTEVFEALNKGKTKTRSMEISSTEIRERIRQNQHVEHLLDRSVWHYIKTHKLYMLDGYDK